jgi:prolyl 4-hydroxylase
MSVSLFDRAADRLRAGDPAAARALFRRGAAAGERRAAIVYSNMVASGAGGTRDWAGALRLLGDLARNGRRSAAELALIDAMRLDGEGDPADLPEPEMLSKVPHVVRFRALFTAPECAYLMDAAAPMLAPSVVIDAETGAQRPDPVRSCDTAGFTLPLENLAIHALNRRLAAASGTVPEQGEPLQVLRYRPGGEYRGHVDAIPGFRNQRAMTVLVWLNDGFGGGETVFPAARLTLRGAPGDAIAFRNVDGEGRPDPASAHAGLPVTEGEKWLASRWIRARPFDLADPC